MPYIHCLSHSPKDFLLGQKEMAAEPFVLGLLSLKAAAGEAARYLVQPVLEAARSEKPLSIKDCAKREI